jgi:hypothetical protein
MLGPVLVRDLPGVVRRGPVLPGSIQMKERDKMTAPEDDATVELDPFEDEGDPVLTVRENPFPYLPRWAILP